MKKRYLFLILLLLPFSFLYAGIHYDISWATQVGLFLLLCYIAIGVQFGSIDDDDIV